MGFIFSLVIPVYNVELYIEKCLLSCLQQEHFSVKAYEIIIVDDGSPDTSIAIVKKVVEQFPSHNVKFVSRANGGLSAARNTGLQHVQGEYVWFIDSDDWIKKDALVQLKEKIDKHNHPQIITFTHLTAFADGSVSKEDIKEDYTSTGFEFLSKNLFLSACTCIYATPFLLNNNFSFKEGMLWEDSEFNLRAYALVKQHYFFGKPLYYYLRRASSITTNGTSFKMVNSWFIKVDAVWDYFQNKSFSEQNLQVINYHLASTIVAAVAGFLDLPKQDRLVFRNKIKNRKKNYWQFFKNSGNMKMKCSGLLIIIALPIAERVLQFMVKRAIKKGEGK